MTMKKYSSLVLMLAASTMLAACQTTSSRQTDAQMRSSKIDSVLERAGAGAAARGEKEGSALINEKVYKRNSDSPQSALQYAKSLRESDYLNRAALVLSPFANEENAAPGVKTEFAAIQLELGRYDTAEEYAQQAIVQDGTDYKAYHYLGIALDAKGQHEEAERAFRIGLDNWGQNEDPTPIMNNLALNLASQSYLDEAIEILEKALAVSPNRQEVERNLRIVQALKESGGKAKHRTPKPDKKPFAAASSLNLEPQMEQPPAAPIEEVAEEKVEPAAEEEKEEVKPEKQSSAEGTEKTAPVVKVEAENTTLEAKSEPVVIGPQKQ